MNMAILQGIVIGVWISVVAGFLTVLVLRRRTLKRPPTGPARDWTTRRCLACNTRNYLIVPLVHDAMAMERLGLMMGCWRCEGELGEDEPKGERLQHATLVARKVTSSNGQPQ